MLRLVRRIHVEILARWTRRARRAGEELNAHLEGAGAEVTSLAFFAFLVALTFLF